MELCPFIQHLSLVQVLGRAATVTQYVQQILSFSKKVTSGRRGNEGKSCNGKKDQADMVQISPTGFLSEMTFFFFVYKI